MKRMSAKEACVYLGIELKTLYQKIHRKEIAYWKNTINRRIEFEKEDLDKLIQWERVEAKK